jgi:AraC-like DNA-binding protein
METKNRIQKAIDFIENHLAEPFTLEQVAAESFYSFYHFHRLFTRLTGYNPKEYIRKRRLARAALDLFSTELRIIDVAMRNGFDWHEAFTRAFIREYNRTPWQFRAEVDEMPVMEKLDLLGGKPFTVHGYEPKLVVKKTTRFFGIKKRVIRTDDPGLKEEPHLIYNNLVRKDSDFLLKLKRLKISRDQIIGTGSSFDPVNKTYLYKFGILVNDVPSLPRESFLSVPPTFYLKYDFTVTGAEHALICEEIYRRLGPYRNWDKPDINIVEYDHSFRNVQHFLFYVPVNY